MTHNARHLMLCNCEKTMRIDADGIEWRSHGLIWRDWRLQLDGSWMRVRDPQGAVELRYRPRLQASAARPSRWA